MSCDKVVSSASYYRSELRTYVYIEGFVLLSFPPDAVLGGQATQTNSLLGCRLMPSRFSSFAAAGQGRFLVVVSN